MLFPLQSRGIALTIAVGLALGAPGAAWANAPATKASVDVDVTLDQPDDEALAARLRGEIVTALNAEGIAVTKASGPEVGAIKLHVRWNADDNHEITAEVVADGKVKTPEGGPWVCDTCRENQLAAKLTGLLPELVPLLPETAAATPDDPGTTTAPDDGSHDPSNGGGRRKLGPLGKTGIPLLVVGVAGAVTGGVLAGMGVQREADASNPEQEDITDFRKPGIPIAVVGGALAITGLALLAVDLHRSRRRATAMAPVWTPSFTGIAVTGRF